MSEVAFSNSKAISFFIVMISIFYQVCFQRTYVYLFHDTNDFKCRILTCEHSISVQKFQQANSSINPFHNIYISAIRIQTFWQQKPTTCGSRGTRLRLQCMHAKLGADRILGTFRNILCVSHQSMDAEECLYWQMRWYYNRLLNTCSKRYAKNKGHKDRQYDTI